MLSVNCNYCGDPASLIPGEKLFYDIPETHGLFYWVCKPCNARVRAHKGSKAHKPIGILQNSDLRRIKRHLNAKLYIYRKHHRLNRHQIMRHLSNVMGVEIDYNNLSLEDGKILLDRLFSRLKLKRIGVEYGNV